MQSVLLSFVVQCAMQVVGASRYASAISDNAFH